MRVPDLVSLSRIPIAGAFTFVYSDESLTLYVTGLALIFLALFTDILDGKLARREEQSSETGYILDGLGDRAIYVAVVLTICVVHQVNILICWLVIFREILIYAVRLMAREWYADTKTLRILSLIHAVSLRLWCLSFLVVDGVKLIFSLGIDHLVFFRLAQACLLVTLLAAAYSQVGIIAKRRLDHFDDVIQSD